MRVYRYAACVIGARKAMSDHEESWDDMLPRIMDEAPTPEKKLAAQVTTKPKKQKRRG